MTQTQLANMTKTELIEALKTAEKGSVIWWLIHAELDLRPVN